MVYNRKAHLYMECDSKAEKSAAKRRKKRKRCGAQTLKLPCGDAIMVGKVVGVRKFKDLRTCGELWRHSTLAV